MAGPNYLPRLEENEMSDQYDDNTEIEWELPVRDEPPAAGYGAATQAVLDQIASIRKHGSRLSDWDRDFLRSVEGWAQGGALPTPKQQAVLDKMQARLEAPVDQTLADYIKRVRALDNLSDWEGEFTASVADQFQRRGTLSDKQVAVLDRILNQRAEAPRSTGPAFVDLRTVPAGRYAVDNRRYKIDRPADGKWAGWIFVKDGSDYGSEERYGAQRPGTTYTGQRQDDARVIAADPRAAAARYGQITGTCGCCGRTLEDPESVAIGIGPVCRAKHFGG